MSKGCGWVPIDKSLVKTLKALNRPYSEVEAMFSHTIDIDCGKPWTYRGYAKLWQWSVGKVQRFVDGMRNTSGTVVGRKGNGSGTEVHFIDKGLWALDEQKRNSSVTVAEHKQVTTINPNPNPNPKDLKDLGDKPPVVVSSKKKRFTPPSVEEVEAYCQERGNGISGQHFVDSNQAKGWVVGKSPMKDWKAAVRTWEGYRKEKDKVMSRADRLAEKLRGAA